MQQLPFVSGVMHDTKDACTICKSS